jgi:hypothetical protein
VANENVEVARGYHDWTKHSEERLRASPHHLDWDNQPVPFNCWRFSSCGTPVEGD